LANQDLLAIQREIVLQRVLNTLLAIYSIGLPIVIIAYPKVFRSGHSSIYIAAFLGLVAITAIRTIPYNIRALSVLMVLNGIGFFALLSYGLSGTGPLFLFGAAMVANLLYNRRAGTILTGVSLAILLVTGSLMVYGSIPHPPVEVLANSTNLSQWLIAGLVFLFLASISMGSVFSLVQGMSGSLRQQEILARQLTEEQASLERRVDARSIELKKRVSQFEIASRIARDISGEAGLENILTTAANLIRDQFGFYHVGIFLNDPRNEYAVLRAATGEAGKQMLEHRHRLRIGETGMVGYVASRGEVRISLNVFQDNVHYKNPMLPLTRSEVALPLRTGARTIGALDVQSVLENAFAQEDVRLLQILADQITIAVENARLLEEQKRSIEELENLHETATRNAWKGHLRNKRQRLAYCYRNAVVEPAVSQTEYSAKAFDTGQTNIEIINPGSEDAYTVLAVPVKLRNQVLGVVDIRFESTHVPSQVIELVQGTVARLANSLDNVRLLEEIQIRAERERLVGEISSKVRAASDVDSVMRIAIQEIGKTLDVSEVIVQLRKDV
jgi:GAF domain-containing protein